MRKALIRALIFAFAGILLFTSTTKMPKINEFIMGYWWLVLGVGVFGFIYSTKLPSITQQIAVLISGILIFRGLVSAPIIDQIITKYPMPTLLVATALFYFHNQIFQLARLHNH